MIGTYELDRSGDTARIRILGSTTWLSVVEEEPIDIRLISEWRVKKGAITRKEKEAYNTRLLSGRRRARMGLCIDEQAEKID